MRIIDIECDIPTREVHEADLASYEDSNDEGMHNYLNIFGPRWAADAGMATEEFEDLRARLEPIEVRKVIARRAADAAPSEAEFIAMLDAAGIDKACIGTGRHASVEHTLELAARHPERLIPWGRINASEGMDGVRRLEFRQGTGSPRSRDLLFPRRSLQQRQEVLPALRKGHRTRHTDPGLQHDELRSGPAHGSRSADLS